MKKFKLLLTMLMLMCFSVGQGWAADELKATLLFDGTTDWGIPTSGTNTSAAQFSDGTYTITLAAATNYKQNSGYLILGKSGSTLTLPAFSWKTTKIAVTGSSSASASVKQNIFVGNVAVSTETTGAQNVTNTYNINSSYQDAGNVYVLKVTSAHNTQITKIEIYGESSSSSTEPSFDASPASVAFGNVLENTETDGDPYVRKEVTLKGANLTDKVYLELDNGFKIYDPTKAAGNVPYMSLTPNASGVIDTTIIVEMYTKQTGTFNGTLSITSEKSTPEFTEIEVPLSINLIGAVTSYDIDFEAGMMDVYTNWDFSNIACVSTAITAHGGTYYGNTGGKSTASITTKSKVALPGTLTFYISKESGNTTASSWVAQVSSDGSTWTDVETFDAKAMDKGVWNECTADLSEYSNVYVRISYGSSTAIRAIDDISLAMRTPAAVENPSISGKTPFYKTTTVTIECVTEGAEIHYTTDGSEPTGGDNTYHNPFEISATMTVKAIAIKGVQVSDVVSKTFTKAEAISVTAAIALIPNADDAVADQFVEGYVCTVGTSVSSGQMTYYISADGTETNRLQVFKGKALNNADFTSAEDLAIGDKVVVYGELKNYKGTPEMNSGNYIVEKVAKGDVQSVAISGEATHGAYEGGDAFDPAGLKVTATYASGYQEDVTASATWSPATITTQSGNTDVTATFGGKTSAAKTVNITLNKYTVTFNTSVYGGTWGIKNGDSSISSGNYFPKGTVLTVVTEAVAGYKLGGITVNDQPLEGNEITIGTENITVAVEFAKVQEGVLVLSTNSLNWGTIKKGTKPQDVPYQTFTLTGSNLTEGRTVKLTAPDWCYLTQTTANPTAGGNIATTSFYVYVKEATLETEGEYSGNIVISSDDLTQDSLVAVSLKVEEATPSISVKDIYAQDITSIDFGNVDKGASVNQFNISLVGHNLTGDVKVTVANATSTNVFVTNGFKPSGTYYQSGGEIDAAVYVIPFTSTGGDFNGTITFHSESGDFDDIVIPLHINIKPDAGLAWSASSATAYTKAKPYTLPTLTNPHDVTVAYSGNNDEVATVNAATGEVTLVAAGEVTITASFAGNGDYVAQKVDYTLTVKAPTGLRLSGEMTTKEYEEGDHVSVDGYTVEAVFGSPYDYYDVTSEATWTLDGVDIATKTVTATAQYSIEAAWQGFTAWEYVNLVRKTHAVNFNSPEHGTLTVKVFGSTFISGAKWKKGTEVVITITPEAGYEGAVTVNGEPLVGNSYTIGTEDITIVATFNKVTIPAGLEWSATSADVRKGGSSNEFPTLTNPNSVEVTYESSDESIATINATTGEISLLANGSTTIKAVFAGNDDYFAQTVEYTLNVSAGIVTITPNPVALDLGDVVFGDDRAKYGKSFHLHIENLAVGEYNQVKIMFTGNAFWTAGNNFITDNDQDGIIDADVTIVPSEYLWNQSEAAALGEWNTTITIMQTGTRLFDDVVAGTATMKVIESTPTALDNVETEEPASKILLNNQLFIIRGEKMYDATGRLVK